jgi:two-component system sensor histidine kinase UhpB
LKINFTHNIDDTLLSGSKKITLFRILQEQLKNIIGHSKATTTQISLQNVNDTAVLTITDNGKGFDPHHTRQGIGLTNIHERTQFYNGTVDITSAAGKGCTLTITIPVK